MFADTVTKCCCSLSSVLHCIIVFFMLVGGISIMISDLHMNQIFCFVYINRNDRKIQAEKDGISSL